MPTFFYTTLDKHGKEKVDTIEALTIKAAAAVIRSQGKIILSLKELETSETNDIPSSSFSSLLFIRNTDIVNIFRQLSILITAGVTLAHSLDILIRQTKKKALKQLLQQVLSDIEEGMSFGDALQKHPVFSSFIVNMIRTGEEGGVLDTVLDRVAVHLEDKASFKTNLITTFIYPSIVIVLTIAVVSFLVGFVIPKFIPMLRSRAGRLPWNTQALLDTTNGLRAYWQYFAYGVGAVVILGFVARRYKQARYWMDRIKLKIPVIGQISGYAVIIQFSRNLALLLKSGVSIITALEVVRKTLGNQAAMDVVDKMEERVSRGDNLSDPMKEAEYIFPSMVGEMIIVGEETGKLDEILDLIADTHEKLLKTLVKRMNTLIEPAITIILGAIVGFVAWSLITGILSIYGSYV